LGDGDDTRGAHRGTRGDNSTLHSELEQAHQALAEADFARVSLSACRDEVERKCAKLRSGVDALEQEKTRIMTDHEPGLVAEQKMRLPS
jgi:hypothetical protein